jgi:tetratricopeptide (TPR) repeat protein
MLAPLHPLDAYRTDAAGAIGHLVDDATQSRWLGAALLLHNAARSAGSTRTAALLEFLEQEGVSTLRGASIPFAPIAHAARGYVLAMEEAAFFRLAHSVLASVSVLLPDTEQLELGRVVALRARIARHLGAIDAASVWYEEVERMGAERTLPELLARAQGGFGILAQLRGDFPSARKHFNRVLAIAEAAQDTRLVAHGGLMVAAVSARDYDDAAQHAWAAYQEAGSAIEQTDMLINLAQLLLDAGHPAAALRGFAAAIAREPQPRSALPALGGAALAAVADSAGQDDRARARARSVVRTVNQRIDALVVALGDGAALPFPSASALVEVSEALAAVGDAAASGRAAWRARILSVRFKFHQLAHRLDHPYPLAEVLPPTPARRQIVEQVEALEGAELIGAPA